MQYGQTLSSFYRPQMEYLKACALVELWYNVFSRVQVQYHYKNYYASLKAWISVCGGEGEGEFFLSYTQLSWQTNAGRTFGTFWAHRVNGNETEASSYTPSSRCAIIPHPPDVLLQRSSRFLVIGKQGIENALKPNISKLI